MFVDLWVARQRDLERVREAVDGQQVHGAGEGYNEIYIYIYIYNEYSRIRPSYITLIYYL